MSVLATHYTKNPRKPANKILLWHELSCNSSHILNSNPRCEITIFLGPLEFSSFTLAGKNNVRKHKTEMNPHLYDNTRVIKLWCVHLEDKYSRNDSRTTTPRESENTAINGCFSTSLQSVLHLHAEGAGKSYEKKCKWINKYNFWCI